MLQPECRVWIKRDVDLPALKRVVDLGGHPEDPGGVVAILVGAPDPWHRWPWILCLESFFCTQYTWLLPSSFDDFTLTLVLP